MMFDSSVDGGLAYAREDYSVVDVRYAQSQVGGPLEEGELYELWISLTILDAVA